MTEDELEIMHLTAFRDLALALAQAQIDNPSQYLCGLATPEQQAEYYRNCLEAAENYDQRLGEIYE